jgi:tRNA(fMet)-specific endonuclease VapC
MNYLLDTNICSYIINNKPSSVLDKIGSKRPEEIAISTVTIAELEYGLVKSLHPDRNGAALLEFLVPFMILDFDQLASLYYGKIRVSVESKGMPIDPMDLLLAAQAGSRNLVLVTNNEKEFQRIDDLRIENWAAV